MAEGHEQGAMHGESSPDTGVPRQRTTRLWSAARWAYRVGLIVLFWLVAHFGANYSLYGQFRAMTLADLVPVAETECVPTVRAMKEYARDHGQWPEKTDDLIPAYLASRAPGGECAGNAYEYYGPHGMWIRCMVTPEGEQWDVHGPGVAGVIPMEPIVIGPGTRVGS